MRTTSSIRGKIFSWVLSPDLSPLWFSGQKCTRRGHWRCLSEETPFADTSRTQTDYQLDKGLRSWFSEWLLHACYSYFTLNLFYLPHFIALNPSINRRWINKSLALALVSNGCVLHLAHKKSKQNIHVWIIRRSLVKLINWVTFTSFEQKKWCTWWTLSAWLGKELMSKSIVVGISSHCFWADVVGNESDDQDRDVGIEDDEVEAEDADDAGEGRQGRLPPSSSPPGGPKWARRTGSRPRPWNKPNTTVNTNTLNKEFKKHHLLTCLSKSEFDRGKER